MKKNLFKSSLVVALAVITVLMVAAVLPSKVLAADKNTVSLTYSAHMQTYGWSSTFASAGETLTEVGKTGESKRMEALEINFNDPTNSAKLYYRAHVQGIGWQDNIV